MPEFFEVKRIKNYLDDGDILGEKIISFNFKNKGERIVKNADPNRFKKLLTNNQIKQVKIKAKYTLFCLAEGSFLLHYRFTGIPHIKEFPYDNRLQTIYSLPITQLKDSAIRFQIKFANGKVLHYYDTRCLSHLSLDTSKKGFDDYPQTKKVAEDLDHFTPLPYPAFKEQFSTYKHDIKTFLLDQTLAPSGIGNYLANEICAASLLNPWLLVRQISSSDYQKLLVGIDVVLDHCRQGADYVWFRVFNRSTCAICDTHIIKKRHKKGAQSTFYCPSCQICKSAL